MTRIWILFTLGVYSVINGLIMPLTKPDGSVDLHSLLNHLTLLEQTVSSFQTKTAQLESEIQKSKNDLQVTKSDLQTTRADLKVQQRHSDAEITSLKDELGAVKIELALKTKPVAFSSRLSSTSTISNQPVKFDDVQSNAGNGYISATGKFTAPVSGIYIFSGQALMIDSSKHQETYLNIVKSGSVIASGYGESSPSIDDLTIPVTTVMYVREREEVWVQSTGTVMVYGGSPTYFVGALVSAN